MGRKVKSYTEEYKNTIIDLFNSGKTYAEISDEYGVPKTTIRQWVKKNNTASDDNISNNDAEIKAMKKRMMYRVIIVCLRIKDVSSLYYILFEYA